MFTRAYQLISICLLLLTPSLLLGREEYLAYKPSEVPNVQLSDSTRFVSDPSDYLSEGDERLINEELWGLRRRYGVEFAVVVVPRVESTIEGFSTELFRLWGLGDKRANDGLLFVLAIEDKLSRFEVGYGLEGYLPDIETSRIWRNLMREHIRKGAYAEGILAGVQAVGYTLAKQEYSPHKRAERSDMSWDWTIALYLYLIVVVFVFLFSFINLRTEGLQPAHTAQEARSKAIRLEANFRQAVQLLYIICLPLGLLMRSMRSYLIGSMLHRASYCDSCASYGSMTLQPNKMLSSLASLEERLGTATYYGYQCKRCNAEERVRIATPQTRYKVCPHCHGTTAQLVQSTRYRKPEGRGKIYRHNTYQCLYCHKTHEQDEIDHDANNDEDLMSLGTGLLIGSMLGGRSRFGGGGGGFSGGSFGGGSSGGGGSTGSW